MNVYSDFIIPTFGRHVTITSDENSSKNLIDISIYGLRIGYRNSWPVAEVNFPKDIEAGNTAVRKIKTLRGTGGVGGAGGTETLLIFVKASEWAHKILINKGRRPYEIFRRSLEDNVKLNHV
jgi:hypothetical protein